MSLTRGSSSVVQFVVEGRRVRRPAAKRGRRRCGRAPRFVEGFMGPEEAREMGGPPASAWLTWHRGGSRNRARELGEGGGVRERRRVRIRVVPISFDRAVAETSPEPHWRGRARTARRTSNCCVARDHTTKVGTDAFERVFLAIAGRVTRLTADTGRPGGCLLDTVASRTIALATRSSLLLSLVRVRRSGRARRFDPRERREASQSGVESAPDSWPVSDRGKSVDGTSLLGRVLEIFLRDNNVVGLRRISRVKPRFWRREVA